MILKEENWDPQRYVDERSKIKAKPCNALWHKAHIKAERRNGKTVRDKKAMFSFKY